MTAPVGAHVRKTLEAVRYTMIQLLFIRIRFCVRFADAFGDDFGVALAVACVLAILALHSCRVFQKVSAQSATHDGVKLLQNEFVTI